MAKMFFVSCAIILLSVIQGYAVEGNTTVNISSAPLYKETATGMEFVFVKGGCYHMGDMSGDGTDAGGGGDSNERPIHEVCVDDFYMGKYEVTHRQWQNIMAKTPGEYSRDQDCPPMAGDSAPVDCINWDDIQKFIVLINKESGGSKFRLPTEAEWEYAARSGGKSERYAGGNDVDSVAWFNGNSGEKPHSVGTKLPNGLGLYDMSGNAWEVTNDWYEKDYYSKSPRNNPAGPGSGEERVKRGGCVTGTFLNQRTSRRGTQNPVIRGTDGFRLLMVP
ncbi:MAG TPA: SUMF1/EgtB/PvdO family nonheme iron enzyme [Desulfuromonadales bacterium]|nr:SUMF1/EgtB/PvdO family nonheme iron enzyme [Desulfuromonadales bacterium]